MLQNIGDFGLNFLNLTPPDPKTWIRLFFYIKQCPLYTAVHGTPYTASPERLKEFCRSPVCLSYRGLAFEFDARKRRRYSAPVFSKRSECYLENVPNPASRIYI